MSLSRLAWLMILPAILLAGSPARSDDFRSARVSDVDGNLSVHAESESEPTFVERNAVLREGDTLWTDRSSRAELELEASSWIRLAEETKVELRRLPPGSVLRLWTGSVYVDLSPRHDGPFRLESPVGDLEVEPNSVLRFDLARSERGRVSVYSGSARVFGDDGRQSLRLVSGERTYLEAGRPPSAVVSLDREDLDSFDRYHRSRVDYYISRPIPRQLGRDLVGVRDLYDYGDWVVVDRVSYWRPRCGPDWRPYSSGYWSYVPGCGYTWIDYAPWGYTTCHYGRWLWRPSYGWLWFPGFRWGSAWVRFAWYDGYCGWAPLDPWDRPCYYGPGHFRSSFGIIIDFRSWSFCDRDRFFFGRHHRRFAPERLIHPGSESLIRRSQDFRLIGDVHRELGVPRDGGRGLPLGQRGERARDVVGGVERSIPQRRLADIERRFKLPANRDQDLIQRPGKQEELFRNPAAQLPEDRILKGNDAEKRMENDRRRERESERPGYIFRTVPGAERRGREDERGPDAGRGPRGELDRRGSAERADPGRPTAPIASPDQEMRSDRDRDFRRGDGGPSDGRLRGDLIPRSPAEERREPDRRDAERRESDRDFQRRESDRREAERRDFERRESDRREADRHEAERRDNGRRESERRDSDRGGKDRVSIFPSLGSGGSGSRDDGFRRDAGAPGYRDFPSAGNALPSLGGGSPAFRDYYPSRSSGPPPAPSDGASRAPIYGPSRGPDPFHRSPSGLSGGSSLPGRDSYRGLSPSSGGSYSLPDRGGSRLGSQLDRGSSSSSRYGSESSSRSSGSGSSSSSRGSSSSPGGSSSGSLFRGYTRR